MRIVAVVCTYWPKRIQNVHQILQGLMGSTRPPDTILLLNNNPATSFIPLSQGIAAVVGSMREPV